MGCHHHHHQLRRLAVLAAALCVVVVATAAARPLQARRHGEAVEMDVSAAAPSGGGDGAVREGKWLPLLPAGGGLMHFPVVGGVSMPWMAGAPPAMAGPGVQLVPPYVGATRQEQLSLWASLFNPFQVRPRLPAAATAETTSPAVPVDIPAIAGVSPEKTAVDEPAAGEPKWGVFFGNNN
ncbi:hypothetical protein OsI_39065 [Oryza sativa Indica Group]|uniref:Uncharacterized protein n=1 Tax=Oryza sativa subsp. indica TaxID=39946 RepID=A2ZML5_ORYSI|nr:hypothetical protein OsI_39065 [Oryza sativa Indica Group]